MKDDTTLCRVLKALISANRTDGLTKKVDVFYAAGKISGAEYTELVKLLTE